jgi:DNA-binding response OmpR family regulator
MAARILVVDDEAMLRRLVTRALQEAGYEVEEAGDGLLGLEAARTAARPFHLVITDSRLPHLPGFELVKRLRDLFPDLPIINLSGSYSDRTTTYGPFPSNVPTLHKPFDLKELVLLVRELLGERE